MAFDIAQDVRDRTKEEEGAWMEYDAEAAFLVARKNNPKYKSFVSKKFQEHRNLITSKVSTEQADKLSESILLEATATCLLRDWRGVTNNGVEVPYSRQLAISMLEEHDDLRRLIEDFADVRANYLAEGEAADVEELGK